MRAKTTSSVSPSGKRSIPREWKWLFRRGVAAALLLAAAPGLHSWPPLSGAADDLQQAAADVRCCHARYTPDPDDYFCRWSDNRSECASKACAPLEAERDHQRLECLKAGFTRDQCLAAIRLGAQQACE